jgi:hypothetical protein
VALPRREVERDPPDPGRLSLLADDGAQLPGQSPA